MVASGRQTFDHLTGREERDRCHEDKVRAHCQLGQGGHLIVAHCKRRDEE